MWLIWWDPCGLFCYLFVSMRAAARADGARCREVHCTCARPPHPASDAAAGRAGDGAVELRRLSVHSWTVDSVEHRGHRQRRAVPDRRVPGVCGSLAGHVRVPWRNTTELGACETVRESVHGICAPLCPLTCRRQPRLTASQTSLTPRGGPSPSASTAPSARPSSPLGLTTARLPGAVW